MKGLHAAFAGAVLPALVSVGLGELFPFEEDQLSSSDIDTNPAISFGDVSDAPAPDTLPQCRGWPGSEDWPSETEWQQFNSSLGGALLRPTPPQEACYPGPQQNLTQCQWLSTQAGRTHFWLDDPLTTLTSWPQGSSCTLQGNPQGVCEKGGWPEYVVRATTVKHIQAAVNFARNKNLRLVIKNTGHDFGGRSMGAGSLSIWVHNLKSFEFLPSYTIGNYSGAAVHAGTGIESWEMFNHMAANNITIVAPGGGTVGLGGWLSVAGHGILTSKYGLGADQVLSINLVTPEGKFLTADPFNNEEMFWALRGGGGSTFGVITSVIMKAYPPISTAGASVNFGLTGFNNPSNASGTYPLPIRVNDGIAPPSNSNFGVNGPAFWDGVSLTYRYCKKVVELGGTCFSYIYPLGNNSFAFTSGQTIPTDNAPAVTTLLQPLYSQLNALGIPVTLPRLTNASLRLYAGVGGRTGAASPVNTRYRSRLFPARNFEDDALWNKTFSAIRAGVEEGNLLFHGWGYAPTVEVAGWPGATSAVNPAWREAALAGALMEVIPAGLTPSEAKALDEHTYKYTDAWKEVTPGSGAYMNEGDPAEKGWQWSFYGSNYRRLLRIKRRVDPWGVFWARTTVGSEAWEVVTDYPAGQNGRLCRVG